MNAFFIVCLMYGAELNGIKNQKYQIMNNVIGDSNIAYLLVSVDNCNLNSLQMAIVQYTTMTNWMETMEVICGRSLSKKLYIKLKRLLVVVAMCMTQVISYNYDYNHRHEVVNKVKMAMI